MWAMWHDCSTTTTRTRLEPVALSNLNQKAAAVQAAIWFFTDRFVLSTSDPLHDSVVAIVEHVLSQGPLSSRRLPASRSPRPRERPRWRVLGPFTVTTDAAHATVTAAGARMFSDAAGSLPIANGAAV